jgi:antitoxin component YwqK of YwqJK toxin-antitoxin module
MALTGNKIADMEILQKLTDEELKIVSRVNKYVRSLYLSEDFWNRRFLLMYAPFMKINVAIPKADNVLPGLSQEEISLYKDGRSWKEYCAELNKAVTSSEPYYNSAKATEAERKDILLLLQNKVKIVNVQPFAALDENNMIVNGYSRNGLPNGILEGRLVIFYPSKNTTVNPQKTKSVYSISNYKNNIPIGVEKTWYENGSLESIRHYTEEGELLNSLGYSAQGELISASEMLDNGDHIGQTFNNGNLTTENVIRTRGGEIFLIREKRWDEKGASREVVYDEDGNVLIELTYYPNGQLFTEMATKSIENGITYKERTVWRENGKILKKFDVKNDKRDGKELMWHENGQLQSESYYIQNVRHGPVMAWNEEGVLTMKGNFVNGKEDGLFETFDKGGKVIKTIIFKDGIRI